MPWRKEGVYMILGDPGTGGAPHRNAPVLMVLDVSNFPMKRADICALWWGNGRGSITPFVRQIMLFMIKYNPLMTAIDSTGPQASTAEVINTYLHSARETGNMKMDWLGSDVDLSAVMNPYIYGYDFSGAKKASYLVAGKMFIEARLVRWPKQASGIRRQLTNYDPEKDTKGGNLAQDIVATFCMAAYGVRSWFNISPEEMVDLLTNQSGIDPRKEQPQILRHSTSERSARDGREEQKQAHNPREDVPIRYSETDFTK
jgi:hypothetical protein